MEIDPAEQVIQEASSRLMVINNISASGESTIQKFYTNSCVFITGGTGLLGKLLIEKLLRVCFVQKIIMLIRPKKDMTPQQRLIEMLKDPVFETLHLDHPESVKRIIAVEGEVSKERLGLNDNDWKTIVHEVNLIFHIAANVRFDVELSEAVLSNVKSTQEALQLGKASKKLQAFVHISTAYAHATRDRIGTRVLEQFYEVPMPPAAMIQMAETMTKKRLNDMTPALIDGWPNTYTFTKALAEETVRNTAGDLPFCIVRPSIVIGTYLEPAPGWLDVGSLYGASGLVLGLGMGVVKVFYADRKTLISLIPADFVINAIITAGWDTANQTKNEKRDGGIEIYTVSNIRNSTEFGALGMILRTLRWQVPTPRSLWYCSAIETSSLLVFSLLTWLFYYLPACVLDGICSLLGKERRFMKLSEKIKKMYMILSFFTLNDWQLVDNNLQALSQRMSQTDRVLFDFDMANIDWEVFIQRCWVGIRKYIIKDGLKGTRKGIQKQKYFYFANFIVVPLYIYIIWKIIWSALFCISYLFTSVILFFM